MTDEFLKIVLLLSVGQGFALSLLLLFKKKGSLWANRILSVFIVLIIIPLWNEYVSYLPDSYRNLTIHPTTFYLQFLYGPLLYLYTVSFTRADKVSTLIWGLLAAGPVFGALFKSAHFYWIDGGFSQQVWYWFFMLVSIQLACCLAACWLRIKAHHIDIKQNLSNLEKAKVDWLKLLIAGYALLLMIEMVKMSARIVGLDVLESMRLVVSISECIFIFLIGFWGISKPEIHFDQVLVKANSKYSNSTLSKNSALELITQLNALMQNEEVFLDNEVSLASLSEHLKVTPHHLSQALNEQLGQNFYDFVNSARIERAKTMLADAGFQKLPIIDVAYQVGFNNKTSFNNAFKKYTQTTPSQFRANSAIVVS
ncbi:helix-turn-helix domain-containing protein [Colwelliaceae bacterium 6471]